jgi:hypothetical protein
VSFLKKIVSFLILYVSICYSARSAHFVGGEITWQCMGGGQYILTLKVYRDCNGSGVSTLGQFIRIWNHPTMSTIPVNFISQSDMAPACTQVTGGPAPLSCSSPTAGTFEEYVFQSPLLFIGLFHLPRDGPLPSIVFSETCLLIIWQTLQRLE